MTIFTHDGQMYEDAVNYHLDNPMNTGTSEDKQPSDDNKKIYFVRHGETDLNTESGENSNDQPVRGWSNVPLNQQGIKEAQKAADSVKDLPIEHIVASDLPRAKQTANIIGNRMNIAPEFDPGLRTWNLGEHTGKAGKDVHDEVNRLCTEAQDERPKGGESFNEFKDRILSTISNIVQRHSDKELLIVSHNSPERILHAWTEAGQPQKRDSNQPVDLNKKKDIPTINPSKELRQPNYGQGRMFGPMIDYIQKQYKELGIKPGGHFIMPDDRGEPVEYERLPEGLDLDWDFMKVPSPSPEIG